MQEVEGLYVVSPSSTKNENLKFYKFITKNVIVRSLSQFRPNILFGSLIRPLAEYLTVGGR